jgi:hypothetical protein
MSLGIRKNPKFAPKLPQINLKLTPYMAIIWAMVGQRIEASK